MEEGYSEIISRIKNKTELVSLKYLQLLDKYKTLKNEHKNLFEELEELKKKYSDLENKFEVVKTARYIELSDRDKSEANRRIAGLIKEIDRCIALLNVE